MIRFWIIALCIPLFFFSCINRVNPPPVARQGVMDLSSWDFQKDGNIPLEGEWEFYWGRLLTAADFKNKTGTVKTEAEPGKTETKPGKTEAEPGKPQTEPVPSGFAMVTGEWNDQLIGNQKFPGQGYATYRLRIKKASYPGLLSLKILDLSSAYRLWINDHLVAENGQVSSRSDEAVPQFLPLASVFEDHSDTLEVIVQISNFFHSSGGLWKSIYLGDAMKISGKRDAARNLQWCLAGAMFILFIYHILIFMLRRKEYGAFWFAMLCLVSAIRMVLTGERVFYGIFPDFPLSLGLKIEYLTMTLGIPTYVMVAREFFKDEVSKKIRNLILATGLAESLFICLFSAKIYTGLLTIIQGVVVIECIYLMYVVIQAMINKRDFAVISFFIYCVEFAAIVNDILYAQLIINGGFLLMYAFLAFLLVQAYILAFHYSRAFNSVEDLSIKLNAANIHLEKKVEERTIELRGANLQLLSEKKKAEDLLLNILPFEIAEELKEHGSSKARRYPSITVMFTDFKNFTRVSEELTPEQLVQEIDYCYRAYDDIIGQFGLEKIKTMGDSYICAGGLPEMNFTHPEDVVGAALAIRNFMDKYSTNRKLKGEVTFEIRIGVHTGPAVAGIVGAKKFAYDIWGDSVNLAARMESSGQVGKVNISHGTYELVKDKFACTYRGKVDAKNKGEIDMYFAEKNGVI